MGALMSTSAPLGHRLVPQRCCDRDLGFVYAVLAWYSAQSYVSTLESEWARQPLADLWQMWQPEYPKTPGACRTGAAPVNCALVHSQRLTTGEQYSAILGSTHSRRSLSVELPAEHRRIECGRCAATPCRTSRAALAGLAAAALARPQRLVRAVERFSLDRFRHALRWPQPTVPLRCLS